MDSVFLLWYVHAPDTDNEDAFLIGVYRTEEDAEAAIERLKDRKGFKDAPEGFQISSCKLNEDQWTEGDLVD